MSNTHFTPSDADTSAIVDAVRRLQDDPALQTEAREHPESALDRLGLQGIARQAVATALAFVVAGASAGVVRPSAWWQG